MIEEGGAAPQGGNPEGGQQAPPSVSTGLWADPESATLGVDFANHLGEDAAPFAEVLNQRFGGQSLAALAKSYGEANKTISEGGRAIGYPGPDATDKDWDRWNKANGVPEDSSGYQLFEPGKEPEGLNEEAVAAFREVFHEEKVPPGLAQKIAARYAQLESEFAQKAEDAYKNQLFEQEKQLQRDWGIEYEDRMNKIKTVVAAQGMDPGDPALFDNPTVVRFLGKMTSLLGEDTVASMREAAGSTPGLHQGGKSEAIRIMEDPSHPDHQKYREGDQQVAAKVNRLLQAG